MMGLKTIYCIQYYEITTHYFSNKYFNANYAGA